MALIRALSGGGGGNIFIGSTVLPTDSVATWLYCAGIYDKNYSTLAQVIADTTTLFNVVNNNNASDYLVRSLSFVSTICADNTAMSYIGANNYCSDKLLSDNTWLSAIYNSSYYASVLNFSVPIMSSNYLPSGEVIRHTAYLDIYEAFNAFGGSTNYASGAGDCNGAYIGYKNTTSLKLKVVKNKTFNTAERFDNYIIQGSDTGQDGSWVDLSSNITTNANETKVTFLTNNNTNYVYHRLYNTAVRSGNVNVPNKGIQFYGRIDA